MRRKRRHKPSPSPLLTFLAGAKKGPKHRSSDEHDRIAKEKITEGAIDEKKVDDILARHTTTFDKYGKRRQNRRDAEKKNLEDDKLDEDFLRSTKLDDYFSADEESVRSISSSGSSESGGRARKFKVSWMPSVFSKIGSRLKRKGSVSSQGNPSLLED